MICNHGFVVAGRAESVAMRGTGGDDQAPVSGELDLAALGAGIWRRRLWIAVPAAMAAILSTAWVMTTTPRYKSEARILIESRETTYLRPEAERSADRERTLLDQEAVASQVQLLLSRDLARKVVREQRLIERPEFDSVANGGSFLSRLMIGIGLSKGPSQTTKEDRVIEEYYERLIAYPVDKSRVIGLEFSSSSAELSARVTNAIAEGYLALAQAAKQEQTRQASQWLAGEIDGLRQKVAEAEARVEQFRARSSLFVGSNNNTLSGQTLSELNSQLVAARGQKSDAENKARMIRQLLRAGQATEVSDVANSELIRRLSEQSASVSAQLAEALTTLMDQHPRVRELRSQVADLDRQIRREAEKIVRALENDARIAGGRVESLLASLDQMKQLASAAGDQDVQLRALEREARAQRDLLESMLTKYREASARDSAAALPADARIVSRATPPNKPSFPKPVPTILVSVLAALLVATGIAATSALLGDNVYRMPAHRREPEEAPLPEAPAFAEAAALVPDVLPAPVEATVDPPAILTARDLCDRLVGAGSGPLLICPTEPSLHGPAAAMALARDLVTRLRRVLVVDAGFAAPTLQAIARDPAQPGLTDWMDGETDLAGIVGRDRGSRGHLVLAGQGGDHGTGEALGRLLADLGDDYDHILVLIDPLTAVAPDPVLMTLVPDAVLALTGPDPDDDAETGRAFLAGFGVRVFGAIVAAPSPVPQVA
jgi:uncharacterized protein involved in exopolysaccharide biosynthesis